MDADSSMPTCMEGKGVIDRKWVLQGKPTIAVGLTLGFQAF